MMTVNLHMGRGGYKAEATTYDTFVGLKIHDGDGEEVTLFFRLEHASAVRAIATAIEAASKTVFDDLKDEEEAA